MALDGTINFQVNLVGPGNVAQIKALATQQLSGIRAKVDLDATGATTNLGKLTANATAAQNAFRQTQAAAAAANATLAGTARVTVDGASALSNFATQAGLAARRFVAFTAAAGSMVRVVQGIKDATSAAVAFDLSMNKVAQVSDETSDKVAGVRAEVEALSTSLGVSSAELAETAVTLKQAGLNAQQTKDALKAIALTDLAPTFGSMKQSTEGLIAAFRQFNIASKDFTTTFGSLNAVAAAYAVESDDIVAAIQRAGGAFKQTGGDLNEFVALFTSVRATTRESADSIATGLRTIFTRFQRPETVDALKDLGINLRYTAEEAGRLGDNKLENQFVGAYEAVKRLSEGLKGLRETDPRYAAVVEQLGGYRQISRVIPLIKQFEDAEKAKNVAIAGGISLQAAAEKRQEALAQKIAKVREEYLQTFRTIVDSKGFQETATALLSVASAFSKVIEAAKPLLPLLAVFAATKLATSIGSITRNFTGAFAAPVGSTFAPAPRRFAAGGTVPGQGNGDTVPALLTPGEFVMSKAAVSRFGAGALREMNEGGRVRVERYAKGGLVGDPFAIGDDDIVAPLSSGIDRIVAELGATPAQVARLNAAIEAAARAMEVQAKQMEAVFGKAQPGGPLEGPVFKGFLGEQDEGVPLPPAAKLAQLPPSPADIAAQEAAENRARQQADAAIEAEKRKGKNFKSDQPFTPEQSKLLVDNAGLADKIARQQARKNPTLATNLGGVDGIQGVATDAILEAARSYETSKAKADGVSFEQYARSAANRRIYEESNKQRELTGIDVPAAKDARLGTAVPQPPDILIAQEERRQAAAALGVPVETLGSTQSSDPAKVGTANYADQKAIAAAVGVKAGGVSKEALTEVIAAKAGATIRTEDAAAEARAAAALEAYKQGKAGGGKPPRVPPVATGGPPEDDPSKNIGRKVSIPTSSGQPLGDGTRRVPLNELPDLAQALGLNAQEFTELAAEAKRVAGEAGKLESALQGFTEVVVRTRGGFAEVIGTADRGPSPAKFDDSFTGPQSGATRAAREAGAQAVNAADRRLDPASEEYQAQTLAAAKAKAEFDEAERKRAERAARNQSSLPIPLEERLDDLRRAKLIEARRAAAPNQGTTSEVLGGGFLGGGTLEQRAGEEAARRIAARGGAQNLSGQTQQEIRAAAAADVEAKTRQELTSAQQRLLAKLYPNMSAFERQRLAAEQVEKAMQGMAAVTRSASGKILGLESTVQQATAAGVAAPGAGGVRYSLGGVTGAISAARQGFAGANERFGAFLNARYINATTATAGLVGLPFLAQYIDGASGEAGAVGNESRYQTAKGASGALTGAVAGGLAGATFGGPIGAAVGATAGALYGLVRSLNDAAEDIAKAKVNSALTGFADKMQAVTTALSGGPDGVDSQALVDARLEFRRSVAEQDVINRRGASKSLLGFDVGGFDVTKYAALRQASDRQNFGPQLPSLTEFLSRQAEQAGRSVRGEKAADVVGRVLGENDGFNREVAQKLADVRRSTLAVVTAELEKRVVAGQRAGVNEAVARQAKEGQDRQANAFGRFVLAAQAASDGLLLLRARSQALGEVFDGVVGASKVSGGADALDQLGRPDRGALRVFDVIAATGGADGARLREAGGVADALARVLPGVLSQAVVNSKGEDGISKQVTDGIANALGYAPDKVPPAFQTAIATIRSEIAEATKDGEGNLTREAQTDVTALAERLLSKITGPASSAGGKLIALLETQANRFNESLVEVSRRGRLAGEFRDQAADLRVGAFRTAAQFRAEALGRRNQALDFLSLRQLEAGQTFRQERLAGVAGPAAEDPTFLSRQLQGVQVQVERAVANQQDAFQKTGGQGPAYAAAAEEVVRLKSRAADLQQALKNLTDVAGRTAQAQEKLNRLQQEKDGRVGIAERLLTADPEEQFRLQRTALNVRQAAQAGSLDGFLPSERRDMLDFLKQAGGVTLSGLPGAPRADDLARTLVENSLGGLAKLPADKLREEKELQDIIQRRANAGAGAADALDANQERGAEAAFKTALEEQRKFFADFRVYLARNQATDALNQKTTAEQNLKDAKERKGQADLLRDVGVTSADQTRASGGDLLKYVDATRRLQEERAKQTAATAAISRVLDGVDQGASFKVGQEQELLTQAFPDLDPVARANITEEYNRLRRDKRNRIPSGGAYDQRRAAADRGALLEAVVAANATNAPSAEQVKAGKLTPGQEAAREQEDARRRLSGVQGLDFDRLSDIARSEKDRATLAKAVEGFKDGKSFEDLDKAVKDLTDTVTRLDTALKGLQVKNQAEAPKFPDGPIPIKKAMGGSIFQPHGTDTVPAMLTPGEFVINAKSAQANAELLHRINNAKGAVQYRAGGGRIEPRPLWSKDYAKEDGYVGDSGFNLHIAPASTRAFERTWRPGLQMDQDKVVGYGAKATSPTPYLPPELVAARARAEAAQRGQVPATQTPLAAPVTPPAPDDPITRRRKEVESTQKFLASERKRLGVPEPQPPIQGNPYATVGRLSGLALQQAVAAGKDPFTWEARARARKLGDDLKRQTALEVVTAGHQDPYGGAALFTERATGAKPADIAAIAREGQIRQFNLRSYFANSSFLDQGQRGIGEAAALSRQKTNLNAFLFHKRQTELLTSLRRPVPRFADGGQVEPPKDWEEVRQRLADWYAPHARKFQLDDELARVKGRAFFADTAAAYMGLHQGGFVSAVARGVRGYASGGLVGGVGLHDTVPALLTPGEFVLNQSAVARMGPQNVARFNQGGPVKYLAEGGQVSGGGAGAFDQSSSAFATAAETLSRSLADFARPAGQLAEALANMPRNITMTAQHTMTVNHNGAEIFAKMESSLAAMMVAEADKTCRRLLREFIPDAGVPAG
jgi:TP901 family phage tail tape measure protein